MREFRPKPGDDAKGKRRGKCGRCNGSGTVRETLDNKVVNMRCPLCNGTGQAT